jgi:hypothetical protein
VLEGNRISYSAGTKLVSAGAPCFDSELRLIALHQAKHPRYNRGVLAAAIKRFLAGTGI